MIDPEKLRPACLAVLEYLSDHFGVQNFHKLGWELQPADREQLVELHKRDLLELRSKDPEARSTEAGELFVAELRRMRTEKQERGSVVPPAQAQPEASTRSRELTGQGGEPEASKLPPRAARAYSQFQAAIEKDPSLQPKGDRAVYDFIVENLIENAEEIRDLATWSRYLRSARSHFGEQKHMPRVGRKGRSTPSQEQL